MRYRHYPADRIVLAMNVSLTTLALISANFVIAPRVARAEETTSSEAPSDPEEVRPIVGGRVFGREAGAGMELDVRARFANGVQIGVAVGGSALAEAYLTGQPTPGVAAASATGIFSAPVVSHGPLTLDLRIESGAVVLHDVGAPDDATRVRQVDELGLFAHVAVGADWLLRAGATIGVELEVADAVELADQTQLLDVALGYVLGDNALLYAQLAGGGTFGFDGDNAKFLMEGSLGLRLPLGEGGARVAF